MINKRPAVALCCAMMGGIILQPMLSGAIPVQLFIILPLVLILSSFVFSRFMPGFSRFEFILTLLTIGAFGVSKARFDDTNLSADSVAQFIGEDSSATCIGTIVDPPRLTDFAVKCIVQAETLISAGSTHEVEGGVIVTLDRDSLVWLHVGAFQFGERVAVKGKLVSLQVPRNPGEFDAKRYYELNDINAKLVVPEGESMSRRDAGSFSFIRWAVMPVRTSIGAAIDRYFRGEEASFLRGLLIGERTEIPADVKASFINSGVMHILAVSGLHVAIVVMMLLGCADLLRIPRRYGMTLTIIVLVYYNFLTGGAASVTRSVVMAIVFLCGKLFELKADMFNTLAVSAVVILCVDSRQLFQPGFQLSFAAVASLVYLYPKINGLMSIIPVRIAQNTFCRALWASVSVSVAAGIGTLPFTAIYFEKISLIGFLANIIIVPLSNIILGLGMAAVAISYISSFAASCLAETVSLCTQLMLALVRRFGSAPFAFVESHTTVGGALVYYYAIATLVNIRIRTFRAWNVIAMLVVANVCVYKGLLAAPSQVLRVIFIDVGQGDAALVTFPDGSNMLVDGGPRSATIDAGSRFIIPYLKRASVTKIDRIVLSHPHSDHLGGLISVLRARPPNAVVDAGSRGDGWLFTEYERLVDSLGVHHDTLRAGMRLPATSGTRVMCLFPHGGEISSCTDSTANLNNESIVLKIVYGTTSLLMMGDAEKEVEHELIAEYGSFLDADVIKIGHHGSSTSSSAALLDLVTPAQGVICVGLNNRFHHPSAAVVERYRQRHCEIHRTDESGAVILESDGSRWMTVDWR